MIVDLTRQHFLCFLPLPHGPGSFLPTLAIIYRTVTVCPVKCLAAGMSPKSHYRPVKPSEIGWNQMRRNRLQAPCLQEDLLWSVELAGRAESVFKTAGFNHSPIPPLPTYQIPIAGHQC